MKLLHSLPPYNFCGDEENDFGTSKAVVLPVPYDSTTSYAPGARNGPNAIIMASRNMELYDEELGTTPADAGIFTLPELEPSMKSPEDNCARVEKAAAEIFGSGKFPLVFGGDHSVSIGAARAAHAHAKRAGEATSILHVDAHADLRDEFQGTKFSHACVARRFSEHSRVVQFGTRSLSREEAEFIAGTGKVKTVFMHEIRRAGMGESIRKAVSALSGQVYVSFDIDAFDPSDAPATGTPEPGGLRWHEALELLRAVFEEKNVVGFDLVELSPVPGSHASDFLAARLAYKAFAYKFKGLKPKARA
ncbi:MAG: agmatinase [Candidatus ainarchaeum sp.]|nr:agmatinase [Candidatus ainarchaeum sp.]